MLQSQRSRTGWQSVASLTGVCLPGRFGLFGAGGAGGADALTGVVGVGMAVAQSHVHKGPQHPNSTCLHT